MLCSFSAKNHHCAVMEKVEEPLSDTLLSRNEIPIIDLAYMGESE